MKVPDCESATVPQRKVVDYLPALDHPEGRPKARFFLRWGFTRANWNLLAAALVRQAEENECSAVVAGKFGTKYTVEAPVASPSGPTSPVRTVWMIPKSGGHPRLITAYPATQVRS